MSHVSKSKSPANLRTKAALEAAGAYDAVVSATALHVQHAQYLVLLGKYTRGAVGGRASIKVYDSVDGENYYLRAVVDAGSYASGALDCDALVLALPEPPDGTEFAFSLTIDCEVSRYVKIVAAETGAAGSPGQLELTALTGVST